MTKPMHPADAADREAIECAEYFNVHLRRSPTDKVNETAATLAEAADKADAVSANGGKPAMIYAVMPEGTSVFVPTDMVEAARSAEVREGKPLTAKEFAMLTAEITGGGYQRSKSRDAAAKRFAKALCDRIGEKDGSPKVAEILGAGSFERARTILAEALKGGETAAPTAAEEPTEAAPAEKPAKAQRKPGGKRAEIQAAAERGELPAKPDFSAPTHARFRKKLDQVIEMAESADIEGLRAFEIKPASTSPRAIMRYRDLAITALEARARKGAA